MVLHESTTLSGFSHERLDGRPARALSTKGSRAVVSHIQRTMTNTIRDRGRRPEGLWIQQWKETKTAEPRLRTRAKLLPFRTTKPASSPSDSSELSVAATKWSPNLQRAGYSDGEPDWAILHSTGHFTKVMPLEAEKAHIYQVTHWVEGESLSHKRRHRPFSRPHTNHTHKDYTKNHTYTHINISYYTVYLKLNIILYIL